MAILSKIKGTLKKYLKPVRERLKNNHAEETNALYRLIYQYAHDKEQALPLASSQTVNAFASKRKTLLV